MIEHSRIVLRDGPAGIRAGLAGHRLDVWEVIETMRNEGGDQQAAANYLEIDLQLVAAALDYYAGHRQEVDQWIERNAAMAQEAEASWRRRRASSGRIPR